MKYAGCMVYDYVYNNFSNHLSPSRVPTGDFMKLGS